MCTRKSIVGRKGKHCADPNEIVDNYINNEFPDKIVVIKLDLFALEKDAWSEIAHYVPPLMREKAEERVKKKSRKMSRNKVEKKTEKKSKVEELK